MQARMQPAWASAIGTTNPHMAARPLTKGFNIACLKQITKEPIPKHKQKNKKPKLLTISQCQDTNLQHKKQTAIVLESQDSRSTALQLQHQEDSTMFFASFTMLSPMFIIIFKCCKRLAAAGGSPSVLRKSLDDLKALHLAASLMHARSSSRLCSIGNAWRWVQCSR